jgi:superoxide dismutase, Cu-Zn family
MTKKVAVLGFLVVVGACHPKARAGPTTVAARATMRNASGASLGVLFLENTAAGVRISGALTSLPTGIHGIHVHAVGKCDPAGFSTAGAHLNPAAAHHGLENPAGPHAGDLPNITVAPSGEAVVDLTTPRVSLTATGSGALFDTDGSALVIHAGADDQKTDPAGSSGPRIACGVIERS